MQQSLFTEQKISKSVYYLAMSGLQKCIRRGFDQQAVALAKIMYRHDKQSLRRRIAVISLEDIGMANMPLVKKIAATIATNPQWESYQRMVVAMCASLKCRDADDVPAVVERVRNVKHFDSSINMDEVTFFSRNSRYSESKPDVDALPAKQVKDDFVAWAMAEAEERGKECVDLVKMLLDFQKFAGNHAFNVVILVLYRWGVDPSYVVIDESLKGDTEWFADDRFPLSGMDGHTRPGIVVQRMLDNRYSLKKNTTFMWEFFTQGARLDRRVVWGCDYRLGIEKCFTGDEIPPERCMEDMPELRRWAWDTVTMSGHLSEVGTAWINGG